MSTLSFRTDLKSVEILDKLCESTERERTYHLNKALERYLETELWHLKAIEDGVASAEAGELTDLTDVRQKWQAKRDGRIDPKG